VGDRAPLFELRKLKSEETIRLKALLGDKPIVLVFGNFTCGPFRSYYPAVDRLYEKYKGRAQFVMVYVREAHPTDGWKMQANTRVGVAVNQPTSFEDRENVASQFCERLDPKIPVVVDEVNDPTGHAYSGMPARLYIVNPDGKVAYKSGRGPFGFKPLELEQALVMSLLDQQLVSQNNPNSTHGKIVKSVITDEEARRLLPPIIEGGDLPIPNWAKAMVSTLPKTTAALLQLDYAHRMKNPLDPKLRSKVRYLIAYLNRCEYAKRVAKADFSRVGGDLKEIESLTEDEATWNKLEADELRFAKLHTVDAPKIEDELFERLLKKHGEKKVAGLIVLGAYANFQDRLLLGLNIQPEGDEAMPPTDIKFDPKVFQTLPLLPSSSEYKDLEIEDIDDSAVTSKWSKVSYTELKKRLELQRNRQQRLPTPAWDDVARNLPENYIAKPTRIVWNLVCLGYIPELAVPWSMTTRTMWAEAPQDRVFEESLFWIQTRAVNCNYCMGHCEMLLEVAGLNEEQISSRLTALSSDQWNVFSETEQRSFAFARKLSLTPWLLTQSEFEQLERDLGPREAMATFFWLCRGLYMTRVSDGFQLRLETDNVFADLDKTKK
ncbi:MAG: deiodinase family protein, partial [Pirellula sp.]|nr:deiodinase family protein [Pirellula sp.]